jgi:hypothetical protein
MKAISLNKKFNKKLRLKIRKLGDELMVMDSKGEKIHAFNETSARIWEWITPKSSLATILSKMTTAYQVDRNQAKTDLLQIVSEMHKLGLIAEAK